MAITIAKDGWLDIRGKALETTSFITAAYVEVDAEILAAIFLTQVCRYVTPLIIT
jgi:hypothetical protein